MFMMLGNSLLEGGCSMLQSSNTVHEYHIISVIFVCSSPPHLWDLHSWKPWHWQALLETGPVDSFPIQAALLNGEAMQSKAGMGPILHLTGVTTVSAMSTFMIGLGFRSSENNNHTGKSNGDQQPHACLIHIHQISP